MATDNSDANNISQQVEVDTSNDLDSTSMPQTTEATTSEPQTTGENNLSRLSTTYTVARGKKPREKPNKSHFRQWKEQFRLDWSLRTEREGGISCFFNLNLMSSEDSED